MGIDNPDFFASKMETASNPANPGDKTANVMEFGDHQQPSDVLEKNKKGDIENSEPLNLPKSLDSKTLLNIQKGTEKDRIEASSILGNNNEDAPWPPVTIESSVGSTEGGKKFETKNA